MCTVQPSFKHCLFFTKENVFFVLRFVRFVPKGCFKYCPFFTKENVFFLFYVLHVLYSWFSFGLNCFKKINNLLH